MPKKGFWLALVLVVALVILDRVTKNWAVDFFNHRSDLVIIPGFFNLTLAFNKGAAFSFLSHASGWQRWLLSGISAGASVVLLGWLYRLPAGFKLRSLSLALILAGALGNFWDRLITGRVVDFLLFYFKHYYWPAFNVADMCIVAGCGLLLLDFALE